MADLGNWGGSPFRPAFYLSPGEKLLYVRFLHAVDLILEDRTIRPTVTITEPKDGATVSGIITVEADIPEGIGVQTMAFRVDGYDKDYTKDLVNPRPYRISLDTTKLPDGPHELVAEAFRSSGLNVLSEKITVKVKNAP